MPHVVSGSPYIPTTSRAPRTAGSSRARRARRVGRTKATSGIVTADEATTYRETPKDHMTATQTPPASAARGLLRTARPRQWSKNLLVLAAPVLSGELTEGSVVAHTAIAFVAFCCAASGVYLVNDARDVEADRAHPSKRFRPVAAGVVRPGAAYAAGAALHVLALVVAVQAGWRLAAVIAVYLAVSAAYSWWLKHEPVLDIAVIASGFLLRAVAGGAASGIELSQWFLLSASFGSLFMAAGKRYAEVSLDLKEPELFRRTLALYSPTYLRFVWTMSAGLLIMTYGLWAFELSAAAGGSALTVASMAPFVLAVLRYAVSVDAGVAGEPEEIALRDHVLQVLAVVWLALVAGAVYVG
ncbi:decaprenyl-phosphate phosphoribosyltransferase [Nocardioides lijunqiniae]|uniref:decaprenyl-phosphate phosphoribosyltransferase n=1 Tax=Nocardioides lijunqiniae TaxID=2760832 RepID=UPI0018787C3A|nr:decaprenyl-phosphate phosphoribosyltransferase [Nocardioides lijunqiniae]